MTAVANADRRGVRRSLAVLCVVVLAGDLGLLYLRQPAHAFTFDDAVRRYRTAAPPTAAPHDATTSDAAGLSSANPDPASPTATTQVHAATGRATRAAQVSPAAHAAGTTGPRAGVYTYATQGDQETNALGGARQAYPSTSTVTVQPARCGWTERWQPLQERWDNWTVCTSAAGTYGSHLTTVVEFFHQTQQDDYDCASSNLFLPGQPQAGQSWSLQCGGQSGTVTGSGTVLSLDTVVVGGVPVRSAHVRLALSFTGKNRGSGQQDRWMDTATGLLVKATSDLDLVSGSVFGDVEYHEHYHLDLNALEPQT